jgi:AcrR family transcriptional regulator
MQARMTGAGERTFTETARRAQIVKAAIATIAEVGYHKASFARIAKQAGLSSTGLISYHFAGRDELIGEVVREVLSAIGSFTGERMAGVTSPADALGTYIHATVAFIAGHRQEMKALLEVFLAGGFRYDAASEARVVSPLEEILLQGQRQGQFRSFDAKVMATLIQRAVDGLPFMLAADPNVDCDSFADEVTTTFELATRASR